MFYFKQWDTASFVDILRSSPSTLSIKRSTVVTNLNSAQ